MAEDKLPLSVNLNLLIPRSYEVQKGARGVASQDSPGFTTSDNSVLTINPRLGTLGV